MTPCSNHPGTIKGAELQKLVAASEKLHARLTKRITAVAIRCGIAFEAVLLQFRSVDSKELKVRNISVSGRHCVTVG